jgi:hypothetical protein
MKRMLAIGMALLAVIGTVRADEADADVSPEHRVELGRNVRLDFEIVPEDRPEDGLFVVAAVGAFELSTSFENEGAGAVVWLAGELELREARILVTLNAEVIHRGEGGTLEVSTSCAALVKPGQVYEVAKVGEKTLTLRATYLD